MSTEQESPYSVTLHGSINGEPHTIEFDTREVLATRSAIHGEVVSEERLSQDALQLANDLHRIHEVARNPSPRPTRMQRLAVRIGTLINK